MISQVYFLIFSFENSIGNSIESTSFTTSLSIRVLTILHAFVNAIVGIPFRYYDRLNLK